MSASAWSSKLVTKPFIVQLVLLGFYATLTVMFGLKRPTLPLAIYYLGCLVKDGAVMALALWKGVQ